MVRREEASYNQSMKYFRSFKKRKQRRPVKSKQLYPLVPSRSDFKTVISLTVHKSIYRRMFSAAGN